jgi:hypothetical protein
MHPISSCISAFLILIWVPTVFDGPLIAGSDPIPWYYSAYNCRNDCDVALEIKFKHAQKEK